jgi:uncharacterized glyoxalase superfamily protein PhnB
MSPVPRVLSFGLCVVLVSRLAAQSPYPTRFSPAIAERADVKQALAFVDERFDGQVVEWIGVTEIPAPSTHEARRAAYVKAELEKIGLTVTVDDIGNVMARRSGTGGGATVAFAAHLDTVHPMDTNVKVTRKPDGTLHAPGVFDNSASVVNLLQTARAMHAARVTTAGDVIFLFTVQEELGLKGMYYWVDHNPRWRSRPRGRIRTRRAASRTPRARRPSALRTSTRFPCPTRPRRSAPCTTSAA